MKDDWQEKIDAYFEGTASPEEVAELDRALREDEELRVQLLESAHLIDELSQVLSGAEKPVTELKTARRKFQKKKPPAWQLLAFAASVVFALGAFLHLLHTWRESDPPGNTPSSLMLAEGSAEFEGKLMRIGERIDPPGRLVAQGTEMALLRFPDGSTLRLEEGAALRLDATANKSIFLEQGALRANVQTQPEDRKMNMETSNSKVTVLGTRFRLATAIVEDQLDLRHGRVQLEAKKTGEQRIVTAESKVAIPGLASDGAEFEWTTNSSGDVRVSPPVKRYELRRWWFTEDFEPSWIDGLWAVSTHESNGFERLSSPSSSVSLEQVHRDGSMTTALRLFRPPTSGPSIKLRLQKPVGWDSWLLQFFYQSVGEENCELSPLFLDYPAGTEWTTMYENDGPEPLAAPKSWNHVRMEFFRFQEGEKWQIEVRRHLNGEHRSTTRLSLRKMPPLLFELTSGACLLDQISVAELHPKPDES